MQLGDIYPDGDGLLWIVTRVTNAGYLAEPLAEVPEELCAWTAEICREVA